MSIFGGFHSLIKATQPGSGCRSRLLSRWEVMERQRPSASPASSYYTVYVACAVVHTLTWTEIQSILSLCQLRLTLVYAPAAVVCHVQEDVGGSRSVLQLFAPVAYQSLVYPFSLSRFIPSVCPFSIIRQKPSRTAAVGFDYVTDKDRLLTVRCVMVQHRACYRVMF